MESKSLLVMSLPELQACREEMFKQLKLQLAAIKWTRQDLRRIDQLILSKGVTDL